MLCPKVLFDKIKYIPLKLIWENNLHNLTVGKLVESPGAWWCAIVNRGGGEEGGTNHYFSSSVFNSIGKLQ